MNNDIKEILESLDKIAKGDYYPEDLLYYENCRQLLDYITNLQEENERLKEIVENLTTMTVCGDRKQIKNTAQYKLDIYKSRNEKAIEYIKTSMNNPQPFYQYLYGDENGKVENSDKLLNILQGDDKE